VRKFGVGMLPTTMGEADVKQSAAMLGPAESSARLLSSKRSMQRLTDKSPYSTNSKASHAGEGKDDFIA